MISPIEGQKSNFKICILRVFILVIMPFIRNVVYSVDQFMFLVSLLFIFLKRERCKAPFHCVLTQRSLRYCSAKENNFFSQSLLPSSLQEKSFTSQTTSKNTFFSFLLTALLKLVGRISLSLFLIPKFPFGSQRALPSLPG